MSDRVVAVLAEALTRRRALRKIGASAAGAVAMVFGLRGTAWAGTYKCKCCDFCDNLPCRSTPCTGCFKIWSWICGPHSDGHWYRCYDCCSTANCNCGSTITCMWYYDLGIQ